MSGRADLVAEIRAFAGLGPGWDGYGADAPKPASIEDAVRFLDLCDDDMIAPLTATLHVDGSVILDADEDDGQSLSFPGDGRVIYVVREGVGAAKIDAVTAWRLARRMAGQT